MNTDLKNFILKTLGAAFFLALAGVILFVFFIPQHYLPVLPWLLLFFVAVTILIHARQLYLAKRNIRRFMSNSMLATLFRLVIYSAIAVLYMVRYPENAIPFVICLILFYAVFTWLEIADLSRMIRERKN